MLNLKFLATTTVVLGSALLQQPAIAYRVAFQGSEVNFVIASVQNLYENINQESIDRLVQMYRDQDPNTELMLSGGYQICDAIKMANAQGTDTNTLINRDIANLSKVNNNLGSEQKSSFSQDQIATMIRTAKTYLCPELR